MQLFYVQQTCFNGTSFIVSVMVMKDDSDKICLLQFICYNALEKNMMHNLYNFIVHLSMSKKRNSNNNLQQFVLYKLYIIIIIIIIITGINITIIIIIIIIIIIFIIIIIRLLCVKNTSSPESLVSL